MKNIAIVMGGNSKEKDISIQSANTIYKHIDRSKYHPYKVVCISEHKFIVNINNQQIDIKNEDFSFILNEKQIRFDTIFMIIHGDPGENGKLCAYFETIKIPYTSCNEPASALTFNKFKCNQYLKSLGYQVPNSKIYTEDYTTRFPCIIKPSCSGSSFGISKVYNNSELKTAVDKAKQHGQEIIIEEFIDGRELTCAVYNLYNKIETLPITEIISQNDIFDYDAKYNGKSIEETPAKIEKNIKMKIEHISKKAYKDLHLSGLIRIDFIMGATEPYIIEINTIPGFSEKSIVPKMLKCAKIKLEDFITAQIENA